MIPQSDDLSQDFSSPGKLGNRKLHKHQYRLSTATVLYHLPVLESLVIMKIPIEFSLFIKKNDC